MEPFYKETLSHYKILEKVGSGGMGEVFLAQDTRLGRKVALKILSQELTNDEQRVLRFKQEARAASTLNHPNIITIYDIGETDSIHFIATEFVKGETLREQMTAGAIGMWDAIDIAIQAGSALAAAHQAGMIHRDIKPENIMRRADGYVKVLDFGLAKLSERDVPANGPESAITRLVNTQVGLIMGTPQYMSPEQVRGFEVDPRSDIYSLGVVLYEIITGKNPFKGATVSDTIAAVLNVDPPRLKEISPGVPERLQEILSKMLPKEAEGRYRSAEYLISDLKALVQNRAGENTLRLQTRAASLATDPKTQEFAITEKTPEQSEVRTTIDAGQEPSRSGFFGRHKPKMAWLALAAVLGMAALIWVFTGSPLGPGPLTDKSTIPVTGKTYQQMTEQEQVEFVKEKAENISAMLGEHAKPLNDAAVRSIKPYVDRYAERANSLTRSPTGGFGDGLRVVYGRASQYAPIIISSFKERRVPAVMGLYIPMLEAEYGACLEAPTGPKGPFQFTSGTARTYGLEPDDRCDIEKVAPAAARYIADLGVEFGNDSNSMTLVVLSFVNGPDAVRSYLRQLHGEDPTLERSFWTLNENAEKLGMRFQHEGAKYVPKFFAAAIVFENPEAFGMPQRPLSTIIE